MKIDQTKCDQCGTITASNTALVGIPFSRMISVTIPEPSRNIFPESRTATGVARASFDFCSERCVAEFFAKRIEPFPKIPVGPTCVQPKFDVDDLLRTFSSAWKAMGLDLPKWREKMAKFEEMLEPCLSDFLAKKLAEKESDLVSAEVNAAARALLDPKPPMMSADELVGVIDGPAKPAGPNGPGTPGYAGKEDPWDRAARCARLLERCVLRLAFKQDEKAFRKAASEEMRRLCALELDPDLAAFFKEIGFHEILKFRDDFWIDRSERTDEAPTYRLGNQPDGSYVVRYEIGMDKAVDASDFSTVRMANGQPPVS